MLDSARLVASTEKASEEPVQGPTAWNQRPGATLLRAVVTSLLEVASPRLTRPFDSSSRWYCEPLRISVIAFEPFGSRLGLTHTSRVSAPVGTSVAESGTCTVSFVPSSATARLGSESSAPGWL